MSDTFSARPVLLVVGAEVTCTGGQHFVALGASRVEDLRKRSPEHNLATIRRRGGRIILAHVGGSRVRDVPSKAGRWRTWDGVDFDGMEVWSFMHDWIDGLGLLQIPRAWLRPIERIAGPQPEVMARYDLLTRQRRVGLVGGLDNHARRIPVFGRLPGLRRICFFEHATLFAAMRQHLFVPPPTGRGPVDSRAVCDALAAGRGFVCLSALGDGGGTRLLADTPDGRVGMGEEVRFRGPGRLRLSLPGPGRIELLRDGQEIAVAASADRLEVPLAAPGVYRAQVSRGGKPWILTNPIYLRE